MKNPSKLITICLALVALLLCAGLAGAQAGQNTGYVWVDDAILRGQASHEAPSHMELENGIPLDILGYEDDWVHVRVQSTEGYLLSTEIAIPRAEEWNGFPLGAMLCESLSMRKTPDSAASPVHMLSLGAGERFVVLDTRGEWTLAVTSSDDGRFYIRGWILSKFTVQGMGTLLAQETLYPLAYPSPDAPCVGEIRYATSMNLIARHGDFYVISLRGASAFLPVTANVSFDGEAREALGLE